MGWLYAGIALFGGTHLFSELLPAVRNRLKAWWGQRLFSSVYSVLSLLGVGLMFWGFGAMRNSGDLLYSPAAGAKHITMLLVLLAFVVMSAASGKGYIRLWLQNPFSIGISLWAIGHLLAVGKTSAVLIYATFLVISLVDIVASMARGKKPIYEPTLKYDAMAVVMGLVVFVVLMFGFHPYILGVPVAG